MIVGVSHQNYISNLKTASAHAITNKLKSEAEKTEETSSGGQTLKTDTVEISSQARAAMQQSTAAAAARESSSAENGQAQASAQASASQNESASGTEAAQSPAVSASGSSAAAEDSGMQQESAAGSSEAARSTISAEDSSSSSSASADLSAKTKQQLDQMVSKGIISKAQENAELAKRAAQEEARQSGTLEDQ